MNMGSIGGEELMKCEKMQGVCGSEEKILVLVRLRPLNEKETAASEVTDWECINNTTILYRNSLRVGSTFPSAYTFDRVYSGDNSTREVYEDGAREIALSVVSGINSSIFAYGQTSSGKTYTMLGITEYTVADIFDYMNRHEERAFVLKFSAIEIYNEAVRDLLTTNNTPLRLLDDPEKGTVVEKVTEETLRDWNHLKELLSICEAQRRIGETSLNEKSSRSHQILKLTIESSSREFLGKGNSTTLSASVNFIDLAGSERASQALIAGSRLKEGCHINRSLLTLSTVIRKLSKGGQGHINYRDSKLTRILQPCLGGNARTAVICTLSPARSHVEQTRNTLLFACCAKEVTTKAQVNIVMSDKALVKHLQKQVARLESELRNPVMASSNCDYVTLLRKKDLQIEKLEKEIRELIKQRDLAQSRVDDLLRVVGTDQNGRQAGLGHNSNQQARDTWEDECSESSIVNDPRSHRAGIRKFNNPHYNDADSVNNLEESHGQLRWNIGGCSLSDSDDYCKEVQCIEAEDSSKDKNFESVATGENEEMLALGGKGNLTSQEIMADGDIGASHGQNAFAYGDPEQKLHDVQKTIDMFGSSYPGEPLPPAETPEMSSSKLRRSWSCRENLMIGSFAPSEDVKQIEATPPNGYERDFPGRPKSVRMNFPLQYDANNETLSRNHSQSSFGTESIKTTADEGITSLHTFVTGLKEMAKLEYDKQLVDGQAGETRRGAGTFAKNVRDIGLDPMQEVAMVSPPDWPLEFAKRQTAILELWHSCNVSLVHRTYFFLLFKGDPTDSIYLEVELRRLSFLKDTFAGLSRGNLVGNSGRIWTLPSSIRALHRERRMLSKLMEKRLSVEERKVLYQKWGIGLNSKRRKVQLANCLWSNTENMNQVMESATIVAKLIKFSEQGEALKEMFGLSFTPPPCARRRSFRWKPSMV